MNTDIDLRDQRNALLKAARNVIGALDQHEPIDRLQLQAAIAKCEQAKPFIDPRCAANRAKTRSATAFAGGGGSCQVREFDE